MKALEVLKKYGHHIKLILTKREEHIIDEAIAELEELQHIQSRYDALLIEYQNECKGLDAALAWIEELMKPKSCEGCKALVYLAPFYYCKTIDLDIAHSTIHTFYCNRYEPKDKV